MISAFPVEVDPDGTTSAIDSPDIRTSWESMKPSGVQTLPPTTARSLWATFLLSSMTPVRCPPARASYGNRPAGIWLSESQPITSIRRRPVVGSQ
jgi:hypothetical protein